MADENENLDSQIETLDEITEDDDIDAVKDKYKKATDSHKKLSDANKQLFSRAKKAEGFELVDGKWVKKEVKKEPKETPAKKEPEKTEEFGLLQKSFLRSAGITAEDEIELAKETSKKWDMSIDKLVDDEDFKVKLEKLRETNSNTKASSNVKGDGSGGSKAKDTPEYWIAKGVPPTREDVPDSKIRRKISQAFLKQGKAGDGKVFYND